MLAEMAWRAHELSREIEGQAKAAVGEMRSLSRNMTAPVRAVPPPTAMKVASLTLRLSIPEVRAGLVDEFLVYLAPKLIGQGRDMAAFGPFAELSQAIALAFQEVSSIGPDLRVLARIPGRDRF